MDADRFWLIIEQARQVAAEAPRDGLMERQIELVTATLEQLDLAEVLDFDRKLHEHLYEAYRWDLWGAAYILGEGCSDDSFWDFRAWLISMGRETYRRALRDPDTLAECVSDPTVEVFFNEGFTYVASSIAGHAAGDDLMRQPPEPAGQAWEEADLPRLLPRLWAEVNR